VALDDEVPVKQSDEALSRVRNEEEGRKRAA
jgi:hypothetical protein